MHHGQMYLVASAEEDWDEVEVYDDSQDHDDVVHKY